MEDGGGAIGLPQRRCAQPLNFLARMLALWPPNPNELFRTALTFIRRGVFGT